MTKIFKTPFATQGDKTVVPVEIQSDGSVSYTQGYGYDYERDQVTDPAAKDIEREKMNSLFHDITESIGEMQLQGFAKWSEAGKPYPIRSVVYHKNKVWQSKIENNNVEPVAGNAWIELKADINANDVGAYSKGDADKRFQPVGKYQAEGYGYSKAESDTKYQPKGNYAPAGNYANKGESYTKIETDGKYQSKGNYAIIGNSYSKSESDKKYQLKGNYATINSLYPVGIVVWFAQNKNPNTLFPGTKWVYIGENKTVRLANSNGNNVLRSGGNDSVILTTANLPPHQHNFSGTTSSFDYGTKHTNVAGSHTHIYNEWAQGKKPWKISLHDVLFGSEPQKTNSSGEHSHTVTLGAHAHTYSGTTAKIGNGSGISVVNAYIMLMGWYRTQ
ncbi:phage baseplate protein [Proteus terrae]|uniref:phage baseplate protein n=1 Tax=Proteus terrae TaxID=1574161 RepID=UPI003075D45A